MSVVTLVAVAMVGLLDGTPVSLHVAFETPVSVVAAQPVPLPLGHPQQNRPFTPLYAQREVMPAPVSQPALSLSAPVNALPQIVAWFVPLGLFLTGIALLRGRPQAPHPEPIAIAMWSTTSEYIEVEVGSIVIWPNPSDPLALNVGRVEAPGLEVAGQRHWNVRLMKEIEPRLYVPSDDRARPVMAKRLRAVPFVPGDMEGSISIARNEMFAKRSPMFGGGEVRGRSVLLEEYKANKAELFQDAAVTTTFLGFLVLINFDTALVYPYAVGGLGGLGYLALLIKYADNLQVDERETNISRLRFAIPPAVMLILAISSRIAEGTTLGMAGQMLSEDPLNILKLINISQYTFLAAVAGLLAHRLPLFAVAVKELGVVAYMEIMSGNKSISFGDIIRDRYINRNRRK